eukprot:gnl/TRDRNA2_/TRDRNA2_136844_c0_seq2.p1 gnl/TRDRNA2_/TRDRNA2_136844_c0~~gnl/TRDRNA2_/TRDRNA2_136844_c0_seq2.p1  ORF type:complete len:309 (+),score=49.13 gnl/TRDRNA2_/TRDRNA2_136844_c0_seq2:295-1221(+)
MCMALVAFISHKDAQFVLDTLNGKHVMGIQATPKISLVKPAPMTVEQQVQAQIIMAQKAMYGPMGYLANAYGTGPYGKKAGKKNITQMTPEQIDEAMRAAEKRAKPGIYKTAMCKFMQLEGSCSAGAGCTYAHSAEELEAGISAIDPSKVKGYKMKLCQFFELHGTCDRGVACTFAHGLAEVRNPDGTIGATSPPGIPAQQLQAMIAQGVIDPMALQAQNFMTSLLPNADPPPSGPGEIRMANADEANKAHSRMQGYLLKGWPMEVKLDPKSQDGTKLIVENLAPDVKWQDLKDAFKPFGKVEYAGRT